MERVEAVELKIPPVSGETALPLARSMPNAEAADGSLEKTIGDREFWSWLARELHDGVTQEVWYLQTELASLSEQVRDISPQVHADLDRLVKVAQEAYRELRSTLDLLHSRSAGTVDLTEELAELVEKFSRSVGMEATFHFNSKARRVEVVSSAGRQVRRLVQEALWNSWRHSMSSRAKVTMKHSRLGLVVTVSNDGCGFDPEKVDENHYGLRNMRERADAVGGRLYMTSREGKGTLVTLHIPPEGLRGQVPERPSKGEG